MPRRHYVDTVCSCLVCTTGRTNNRTWYSAQDVVNIICEIPERHRGVLDRGLLRQYSQEEGVVVPENTQAEPIITQNDVDLAITEAVTRQWNRIQEAAQASRELLETITEAADSNEEESSVEEASEEEMEDYWCDFCQQEHSYPRGTLNEVPEGFEITFGWESLYWSVCPTGSNEISNYWNSCPNCLHYLDPNQSDYVAVAVSSSNDIEYWCASCSEDNNYYCPSCSNIVVPEFFYTDDDICISCYEEVGTSRAEGAIRVEAWNYRPLLVFRPVPPTDSSLYIGMELEVTWPNIPYIDEEELDKLDPLNLLYFKGDGSVSSGIEVVTHPFQPLWGLENFPYKFFEWALENGAHRTNSSCGTHIHMNKDSFTDSHLWKFLQFHERSDYYLKRLSGRESSTYARWKDETGLLPDKNSLTMWGHPRKRIAEIAKTKRAGGGRYVAVNLLPDYTLELRYLAGDVGTVGIKKNIQLAHSLWAYTKQVTVPGVAQGELDSPEAYIKYVSNNRKTYPELYNLMQRIAYGGK